MIHNCFKFAIAGAAAAVMMASSSVNAQTTFTVMNLNNDTDTTGLSPEEILDNLTLRQAIRMANSTPNTADMIVFDPSVSGTIELESQMPDIRTPMTIDGGGRITLDAGDGDDGIFATGDGFRIFNVDDDEGDDVRLIDNITLIGLTLTGGDNPINAGIFQAPGGAIRNREILNLINVQVINNSAGAGGTDFPDGGDAGGIFNLAGILTLTDCTVSGNVAGDGFSAGAGQDGRGGEGGGIFSTSSGRLTDLPLLRLVRTTVSNNTTGMGGTNDGDPAGGGRGGGIYCVSIMEMENCTVSGNRTVGFDADGGGISFVSFGSNRDLTISNSTITNNVVSGEGSGGGAIYSNRATIIENSIVAGNVDGDGTPDIQLFNAGSLISFNSLFGSDVNITFGQDNLIGVSANLGPLADNGGLTQTHALLPGSPAIDAGDPDFDESEFDQRGAPFTRVFDSGGGLVVDMGAYELSTIVDEVLKGDANCDGEVNFLDITPFIAILSSGGFKAEADVDMSGEVDFLDIPVFIQILGGGS